MRFDWLRRCRTTSMFITNFIQLCRPFKIQPLKLCYRSRFPHLQMKQADHWHFQLLFLLLQYNSLISKQKGRNQITQDRHQPKAYWGNLIRADLHLLHRLRSDHRHLRIVWDVEEEMNVCSPCPEGHRCDTYNHAAFLIGVTTAFTCR